MLCVPCAVVQRSVSRESEGYFSHNQSISHSRIRVLTLAAEETFLSDSYFYYNYLDYYYFVILFVSQVVFSELFCTASHVKSVLYAYNIPNKDVNMPSSQPNHGHIGLQIRTPRAKSIPRRTGFKGLVTLCHKPQRTVISVLYDRDVWETVSD